METLWFCLVATVLVMYVVLDGFDIGAGIVHLLVARNDEERRLVLRSIGPVWDGNEVWLLAGGGTLYFAFPRLYAASFNGFYLPLMIVLWLLMLRGIAVEFRSHLSNGVWKPLWDVVFSAASTLLAVFFGAALGNVVRGVPMGEDGRFFEPLWTNFRPGADAGILDWYTVLVGVTALGALAMHGALWVALKTAGRVQARARALVPRLWGPVLALTLVLTAVTFALQPHIQHRMGTAWWGGIFPLLALCGLGFTRWSHRRGEELRAFLGSCGYLLGMLTSAAHGLYPYVLPAVNDPTRGLTVFSAAAAEHGLRIGILWWIPGMALAVGYAVFLYRRFAGKVSAAGEGY